MEISEYSVRFSRNPILGCWTWTATTPDGRTIAALFGMFINREAAERDALHRIEIDASRETVSGSELQRRVSEHSPDGPAGAHASS